MLFPFVAGTAIIAWAFWMFFKDPPEERKPYRPFFVLCVIFGLLTIVGPLWVDHMFTMAGR